MYKMKTNKLHGKRTQRHKLMSTHWAHKHTESTHTHKHITQPDRMRQCESMGPVVHSIMAQIGGNGFWNYIFRGSHLKCTTADSHSFPAGLGQASHQSNITQLHPTAPQTTIMSLTGRIWWENVFLCNWREAIEHLIWYVRFVHLQEPYVSVWRRPEVYAPQPFRN